jgi:hypothetical protein
MVIIFAAAAHEMRYNLVRLFMFVQWPKRAEFNLFPKHDILCHGCAQVLR